MIPPLFSRSAHLGFQQIQELPHAVFGGLSHSLSTIPAVFHLGAPQCLAIPTGWKSLQNHGRNLCSVPLLAIINSSRWLLAFVLGYGRVSLPFTAALSKYYSSQHRRKSTSIPVLEHPGTNLALKMTLKLHTFLILCNNAHSEMHVQVSRHDVSAITGNTARSCTLYSLFSHLDDWA